ncbi:S-adenosyl-L-methionine-dependent methyltransferase [Kickxella alabastrina]|uniref:S-adenosyl-L-methionine-dependent methyltransferase n=1 Tax=Kickxella alabastrina TaxID=61397 RepID=UPI002220BE60|nr:S-adenosyl-L-methionine-dependent methyltransferase [Kickxella alabastrina]KAI7832965.1 S-adenosyl-L-methionine-dependent methyltransferase [Kickxella alabastrina]
MKLRNYLVQEFRDILVIRSDITQALREKRVHVNNAITLDSHALQSGDIIEVAVDPQQAVRSRLRGLDIEVMYREPGMLVMLKAPGVSQPDVEWAAPAILQLEDEVGRAEGEAEWIAVNKVEKGVRSLVVVVKGEERRVKMMEQLRCGNVEFEITAICHGEIDQETVSAVTTHTMKAAAAASATAAVEQAGGEESTCETSGEPGPCMDQFDLWLQYNHFPSDVFDHTCVHVESIVASSSVGHLSVIRSTVQRARNPSLVIRRLLYELHHPVVGTQNHARPLPNHRDKGALLAFTALRMPSLHKDHPPISVSAAVPPKFLSVCARETKFHAQRQQRDNAEIDRHADQPQGEIGAVELVDGVPAAYVSGMREFCGRAFMVTRDTLIPRPSTETLVAAALAQIGQIKQIERITGAEHPPRIMDLGTGSGCILLSVLLGAPTACGLGVDISTEALAVAMRNTQLHMLQDRAALEPGTFLGFSVDAAVLQHAPFDLIACNPPYVSAKKIARMHKAIKMEPRVALVAEDGGYQAYREIRAALDENPEVLSSKGCVALEVGKDMEKGVRRIFLGWDEIDARRDSQGFLRVLVFQRPE